MSDQGYSPGGGASAATVSPALAPALPAFCFGPTQGVGAGSAGAANLANFTAFMTTRPMAFNRVCFAIDVASGNVDGGIYDDDGVGGLPLTLLSSSGSTPCPAASATQGRSLVIPTVTLDPGFYWAALAFDNAVASSFFVTAQPTWAVRSHRCSRAASFPLPASAAGAAFNVAASAFVVYPAVA